MKKFVINVSMNTNKSRAKAMQIVLSFPDIKSANIQGKDQCKIEIVGDEVDPVNVMNELRKGLAPSFLINLACVGQHRYVPQVELFSVALVEDKKEVEEKKVQDIAKAMPVLPTQYGVQYVPVYYHPSDYHDSNNCSIM